MNLTNRTKILLIIKVPPPYTGATMMNLFVKNSTLLKSNFYVESIDISYSKSVDTIGELSLKKLTLFFKYLFLIAKKLLSFKPHLVYFQISTTGIAFKRDLIFSFVVKLLGFKILYHLHGKGINTEITKSKVLKYLARKIVKNEYVICLSEFVKSDIESIYDGKPYIVYDGIPIVEQSVKDFSRRKSDIPTILYYSNFSTLKGLPLFIIALKKLNIEQVEFKVNIAGRDADLTFEQVQQLIEEAGITHRVQLYNNIDLNKKIELFNTSNVFIFPTIFEAFGTVVLEAMQFELPVITSDEGSLPLIVEEGKTGYLFKTGDVNDMVNKIRLILSDKDRMYDMGKNAKLKFENEFTLDIFEKNLVRVIDSIILSEN